MGARPIAALNALRFGSPDQIRPSQEARPNGIEARVPINRPSRIDSRCRAGGAKRSISRMTTSVKKANPRFSGEPNSGDAAPPPAQPAATAISDSPMMRITVPVTGASSIMKTPEAITEP